MAAHLHWRIYITAGNSTTWLTLGELEMRSSVGGANLCSGGTASALSANLAASNAFDGSLSTYWQSSLSPAYPHWLRYTFASPVDIVQVVLKATSNSSWFDYAPKDADIQWSDDGTNWTTLFSATGMTGWTAGGSYTATLGGPVSVRTTAQSLEVLTASDPAPIRATAQSLEVIYSAGDATGTVPGNIYQVNSGSTYSDPLSVWNNDPDSAATTLTNLFASIGISTSVTYSSPAWDSAQTDGVAHADLPTGVSSTYLKWFASARVVTFGGLNAGKTYTLKLYSTAPGSVSVNWTIGASTKALVRGSKVEWTGLSPDGSGVVTATSASTSSGSDATLSAAILVEEQTQPTPALKVRATSQALETLLATYQQRIIKAVSYAVLGTRPGVNIVKSVGFAVLRDPAYVTSTDAQTVLLLHCEGAQNGTVFIDSSPSNKFVTTVGGAQTHTAGVKFGTTGGLFDGSGDYLTLADSDDWSFGSGPFTVECWVKFASFGGNVALIGQSGGTTSSLSSWALYFSTPVLRLRLFDGAFTSTDFNYTFTPTTGVWYHVAADRDASNMVRLYLNGAVVASGTYTATLNNPATLLRIGRLHNDFTNFDLNGYLDEIRVSKGVARYQGAFTPATSAFFDVEAAPSTTRRPVIAMMG